MIKANICYSNYKLNNIQPFTTSYAFDKMCLDFSSDIKTNMYIIWSISVLYNNIIFTFSLHRIMECGYRYKYIQESVQKLLIILRYSHISYVDNRPAVAPIRWPRVLCPRPFENYVKSFSILPENESHIQHSHTYLHSHINFDDQVMLS